MNTVHVVPAGEFQPHSKDPLIWKDDLNLWRTIMREYAEEFLREPDAAEARGAVIDFAHQPPYSDFNEALDNGQLKVYLLGLGLEPITWKPEICTACVWDAGSFDRVFGTMGTSNAEGDLITGQGLHGWEFNAENIATYVDRPGTDPACRACLTLAWRGRKELGLR